jgi:hypothetical protein
MKTELINWQVGTSAANSILNMSQPEIITWSSKFKWNGKDGRGQPLTWNGIIKNNRTNMAIHVSLGFAQLKDKELLPFTAGVVTGLTGNTACPTPPVTAIVLDGHRKIFEDALAKAAKGSVADTAAKDDARDVLVDDLRVDAAYVELKAAGVAATITSTGYLTITHDHNPVAIMPKAVIKQIINQASGQLLVRGQAIDNAYSFEAQIQNKDGTWQTVKIFSQVNRMLLENLTPGTTYTIRIRAIGANDGAGEWSDPVSHICT